ncbi:MAG TPA: hypothetical protein EYG89_05855 [Bacteroidia bacterium]|nr:hypothetical protein [Bacteroidia bacterium]
MKKSVKSNKERIENKAITFSSYAEYENLTAAKKLKTLERIKKETRKELVEKNGVKYKETISYISNLL